MRNNDITIDTSIGLKEFWKNRDRFADIFNAFFFQGKSIVQPENLKELESEETAGIYSNEFFRHFRRVRDVAKGVDCVILGIENQTNVHYAMPLRTMIYDMLKYQSQVEALAKHNMNNSYLKGSGEFLSGLKKDDRLLPVLTLIIYYGSTPWDGPRTLKDMLRMDDNLIPYVNDYNMHLLCLNDPGMLLSKIMNTDVKNFLEIMDIILHNKDKRKGLPVNYSVSTDVLKAIGSATGSKEFIKLVNSDKGGSKDMHTLIDDILEEGKKEGKKEGSIKTLVETYQELGQPLEITKIRLMEKLNLDDTTANEAMLRYWKR